MPKLKVDLKNGLVEVEGDEALVKEVYADYKEVLNTLVASRHYVESQKMLDMPEVETTIKSKDKSKLKSKKTKSQSKAKSKESHKIVADLNLLPQDKESFTTFFARKTTGNSTLSNQEFNVLAVYYLKNILGIDKVSPDHIYSCYKDVGQIVPIALVQSLRDTASLKSWIDTSDTNDIKLLINGENLVEHKMPKVKSK